MHSRQKPPNPWNKNIQQKKTKQNVSHNLEKPSPTPSEVKFKEAQSKLQAAVKKHVKDYESSSEEEELESSNLIGKFKIFIYFVLKNLKLVV
ncbi:hypothetical protein NQ314_010196 [Rhamnusium bicolor]|uniref:Uncharacterized protein n=1 Tax=Rhamnusium bicolor TaxID=1586634 RepID=A0AAV8XTC6_9CUCU|nr:hypothetical protein NQ314_010196 [Rhamnusium bicolor]